MSYCANHFINRRAALTVNLIDEDMYDTVISISREEISVNDSKGKMSVYRMASVPDEKKSTVGKKGFFSAHQSYVHKIQ